MVYKGKAGWCLLYSSLLALSASSSWIFALSFKITAAIPKVGRVPRIGFLYPCFTNFGRYPVWSRWAWVSNMRSILLGSNGKSFQLSSRKLLIPWKSPQSIRKFNSGVSTRNFDPVTVPEPPRK